MKVRLLRFAHDTVISKCHCFGLCLFFMSCLFLCGGIAVASERITQFSLPDYQENVVGELRFVAARQSDTLSDIAKEYGLGYDLLRAANPAVDPWMPEEGETIVLPFLFVLPDAPRVGIVVNVAEKRLYYYPPIKANELPYVEVYSVSIGRQAWSTPIGQTKVTGRAIDPAWYPPQSIRDEHMANGDPLPRVVPAGPQNPLGRHLLQLGMPGYFIHGTNKPFGIGMQVTHGCIRMYPKDIEHLVDTVANGTRVIFVNQPYKIGWKNNKLYAEVHPPLDSYAKTKNISSTPFPDNSQLLETMRGAMKKHFSQVTHIRINQKSATEIWRQSLGIPVEFGVLKVHDL